MQPNSDQWQQPEPPTTAEPHPYAAPVEPAQTEEAAPSSRRQPEAESQIESEPKAPREGESEAVRWQAVEHVHHEKNILWYVLFALVTIGFAVLGLFVFKSISFTILVPLMAAALIVYSLRPPALLSYTLSRKGLHVNDKLYPFEEFKEFGLISDDEEHSVMLVPRKRFNPGVTVYFPEEVGEAVVDMLAARLPMHQQKLDPIERLIRLLRI